MNFSFLVWPVSTYSLWV